MLTMPDADTFTDWVRDPTQLDCLRADKDWAFRMYETFARGGHDEHMKYFVVPGDPWSKSRPRFSRMPRGGTRTYQPRDDRMAEQRLKAHMLTAVQSPFLGNVMLACRFYRSNFQRIDTDNLLKHVCDSANGALWKDDCQATLVFGEVHHDPDMPRTVIVVGNHESTLVRGSDADITCVHCGQTFKPPAGKQAKARRFCSTRCAYAARTTVLSEIACRQCGTQFRPITKKQVLCSRACRAEELRGRRRAKAAPKSKCGECGKQLAHSRGGRCRSCWRANPRFYADAAATLPIVLDHSAITEGVPA